MNCTTTMMDPAVMILTMLRNHGRSSELAATPAPAPASSATGQDDAAERPQPAADQPAPPRKDKPSWIVSPPHIIEDDRAANHKMVWLARHPFPGVRAPIDAKMEWVANLHDTYELQQQVEEEEEYDCRTAQQALPDPNEIVREILRQEAAGHVLVLELLASTDELRTIGMDPDDMVPEYGLGEARLVPIGTIECRSDDRVADMVKECAERYGYGDYYSPVLREVNHQSIIGTATTREGRCHEWGIHELVGENMYFPLDPLRRDRRRPDTEATEEDDRLVYSVHVGLRRPTERDVASRAYLSSLDARKRAATKAGDPKDYVLVPRAQPRPPPTSSGGKRRSSSKDPASDGNDRQEDLAATSDTHTALWVPLPEYNEQKDRVVPHFTVGQGECRSLRRRLLEKRNAPTDAGNARVQILEAELRYIKQLKSWREKFCAALALTRVAAEDTRWMRHNDRPEEVIKHIKDLAAYWRTILLKKDDATLGLGLGRADKENGSSKEGGGTGKSDSRLALEGLLQVLSGRFENANAGSDDDCGGGVIRFNWKLGHSRNPKRPNAQNKRRRTGEK